jgi:predicted metal-dependent phosphoesterase TrpH
MFTVDFVAPDLPVLAKEGFVADMHFHTSTSHDSKTMVVDIIKLARKLGVAVAVTDHNQINGAVEASRFKDVNIIPAIEICTVEGKEVIPYFYDAGHLEEFYTRRLAPYLKEKNALRSNRTSISLRDLLAMLDEEECVVSLPHPFAPQPRQSYRFVSRRRDLAAQVDVVEVFNQSMTRRANLAALGWAVQLRRGAVGGSDGHVLKRLGQGVTVTKATSVAEHLDLVAKGAARIYGVELKAHQRVLGYASTTVRHKLRNGVAGGLRKGFTFPARASRRLFLKR